MGGLSCTLRESIWISSLAVLHSRPWCLAIDCALSTIADLSRQYFAHCSSASVDWLLCPPQGYSAARTPSYAIEQLIDLASISTGTSENFHCVVVLLVPRRLSLIWPYRPLLVLAARARRLRLDLDEPHDRPRLTSLAVLSLYALPDAFTRSLAASFRKEEKACIVSIEPIRAGRRSKRTSPALLP